MSSFVVCLSVCSLNVHIFVPRLILNFNMFYKTVKAINIKFFKSRKFFASWVLVPLNMAIMTFCLFLRPRLTVNCYMYDMHAPNFLILGIQLLWALKNTFAKL